MMLMLVWVLVPEGSNRLVGICNIDLGADVPL